jgi:hypothetical protein
LTQSQAAGRTFIPASVVLQELHDAAPADQFTLGWLMGRLQKQSFGLIMLLLAIVAVAPGISVLGGLLLLIPAFQMIAGRSAPVFPRWIADRSLPTKHLGAVVQRATSMLKYLEKVVRPRCPTPPELTKRVVGIFVVLLSARLLLMPIPLSNILPAVLIALISLGYLEEDGVLLSDHSPCGSCCPCSRPDAGLGGTPRRKTKQALSLDCSDRDRILPQMTRDRKRVSATRRGQSSSN